MPAVTDYYAVLGVDPSASPKEIKKAYRAKARDSHPDTNAGDAAAEEQFKAVQQAYDTLGDEKKRAAYDRARQNPYGGDGPFGGFAGQTGAPPGGGRFYRAPDGTYVRVDATGAGPDEGAFTFGGDGIGDLFERYFGGAGASGFPGGGPGPSGFGGSAPRGGRDVEASVRLSFEEALEGGPREFSVPTTGETVRVTVPKGVRNGLKIKLGGRGEAGPRGDRGDLFLTFQVTPDARFRRDGDDLVATESITAVQALLGTTLSVRTAYGQTVRVTVRPGTAPGAKLRVRGQGVRTDKATGDLTVEIAVTVPDLSDEARDGLRTWAEANGLA